MRDAKWQMPTHNHIPDSTLPFRSEVKQCLSLLQFHRFPRTTTLCNMHMFMDHMHAYEYTLTRRSRYPQRGTHFHVYATTRSDSNVRAKM